MSSLIVRQNLSVADREKYYTSLWSGDHSSSFSSSQARGWLTDLDLVGKDGQGRASVKVHKAVILPLSPVLSVLLHDDVQEGTVIFPEVPVEVVTALVQLIYKGECSLSPVADVVAIMNLARDLGFRLQINKQEVNASDIDAVDNRVTVNKVSPVINQDDDGDDNVPKAVIGEIPQLSRAQADINQGDVSEVKDMNRNIIKKKNKSDLPKFFCEHCDFR